MLFEALRHLNKGVIMWQWLTTDSDLQSILVLATLAYLALC